MANWHAWTWGPLSIGSNGKWKHFGSLEEALRKARNPKTFKLTTEAKDDLLHRIKLAKKRLKLQDSANVLLSRFLANDFPGKFIEFEKSIRRNRKR